MIIPVRVPASLMPVLAATRLDECEMWLARCKPTAEALGRDLCAPAPAAAGEDGE